MLKRYLFIGAPGVGKGTYAGRISETLTIPHIAAGDLLRAEAEKSTPLGKEIKNTIDKGSFVPDRLIFDLMKERIASLPPKDRSAYILDGYPRSRAQAEFVFNLHDDVFAVDHVIALRQPFPVILAKMSSRRSCADCGMVYNYASIDEGGIKMDPLLPKVEGKCDRCGSTKPFITRVDDEYETVKLRLEKYQTMAAPLELFYHEKGMITYFDVLGGATKYLPKLLDLMKTIK